MKKLMTLWMVLVLFTSVSGLAQSPSKNLVLSGTVIEAATNQPLEYASVYAQNKANAQIVSGGMTDAKGKFEFEVPEGEYYVKIDFLGFKTVEINSVSVVKNTSIGEQKIFADSQTLAEVNIIAERSTVEIKLDKKVYNVGQDMIVKGGTASDVLDNVPSVSVDVDGTVSLRGNENVKVLIDGKPTGLASNIAEAMKILSAESIEKVEVITNPSARYEAEGGAGIINIVLRKGKSQGINGSLTGTVGDPMNYGLNGTINFRSDQFNMYTVAGYNHSKSNGSMINNSEYLNPLTGLPTQYIDESKPSSREREGYNINFGLEWFLTKSFTWTNAVTLNKNQIYSPNTVYYNYYDQDRVFDYARTRDEDKDGRRESVEYTTTFEKNFAKDGHKLTVSGTVSVDKDNNNSLITDQILSQNTSSMERTLNNETVDRNYLQADYILPLGENAKFEAGYLGNFSKLETVFVLDNFNNAQWINNTNLTNTLEYKEKVHALYAQFGSKINRFSYMLGLRYEDTEVDVNQLITQDYNNKNYDNFFPSAFLNYEFSPSSNLSLSYSKRVNRPRGFFLNPFSNYSSDINFFQGNPDLDPALTNAFDLGYMHRWTGFTLSTSAYVNITDDAFQFVKRINGTTADGTPITVSSPINLATEYRYGFEFTLNATPFKWWRLNGNFNFYRKETQGDYTFTDFNGNQETQNFDNTAYSWFTRITSRVSLPYKIDWQMNGMYRAKEESAQGVNKANLSANMALSKDILKDNGTLSLNVSDIFNSRKRETETHLPQSNSFSEMQWRGRQVNLSFTYRFNQKKTEKPKFTPKSGDSDGAEMIGA
ncbi:TonB-dependent receptor domain-containing protein [Flavobacterium sp. JP2137]|uniref:TonB-dependent receptor domain-containing protein n=1 Tax=Flavobacterium sp. JP2137 TaxID=3414510 RepID=UPI003D2FB184